LLAQRGLTRRAELEQRRQRHTPPPRHRAWAALSGAETATSSCAPCPRAPRRPRRACSAAPRVSLLCCPRRSLYV
jgi:hypothetical protein